MRNRFYFELIVIALLKIILISSLAGQIHLQKTDEASISKLIEETVPLSTLYPDSALTIMKAIEKIAIHDNERNALPKLYSYIVRIYSSKAMIDSALYFGRKGMDISGKILPRNIPFSARALGEVFHKHGQLDSALFYLLKAESNSGEGFIDEPIRLYVLLEIKDVYRKLNDTERVKEYLNKSILFLKNASNISKTDRIIAMHEVLSDQLNSGDTIGFSKGLSEYLTLLEPFKDGIVLPAFHVEMFQFNKGSDADWIKQLQNTLSIHRKLERWDNLALCHYLLAQTLLKNGYSENQVLANIDSCINVASIHKLGYIYPSSLAFKTNVLANSNDYKRAYETSNLLYQFQDSINMLQMQKNVDELNIRFETEQKGKQILEQEIAIRDKERQRNILLVAIGFLGAIAFALETWRRSQIKSKELAHLQMISYKDVKIAESRVQMMRAQMNPHFLFNSLNSIKHFILQKPRDESAQYISDFSKLMRLNLQNSAEKLISLDREILFLKQYLLMEQMRFKEPFEVEWFIEERVDLETYLFPPMLIQPYIENAIWHGLRYKKKGGKILIHITSGKEKELICVVEDNGIGRAKSEEIKASSLSLKKSMGTQITEDRISMNNSILNTNISVSTEDLLTQQGKASGTRVTIIIPFISAQPS